METKVDVMRHSKKVELLAQIAHMYRVNHPTISTSKKDEARILEHERGSALRNSTIITKQSTVVLFLP